MESQTLDIPIVWCCSLKRMLGDNHDLLNRICDIAFDTDEGGEEAAGPAARREVYISPAQLDSRRKSVTPDAAGRTPIKSACAPISGRRQCLADRRRCGCIWMRCSCQAVSRKLGPHEESSVLLQRFTKFLF